MTVDGSIIDVILVLLAFALGLVLWWGIMLRPDARAMKQERPSLKRRFRQAGIVDQSATWFFWVGKVLLAVLFALLAGEVSTSFLLLILLGCIGFFLPDLWLMAKIITRKKQISKALTFYLDLVNSLLRAGMTLERSLLVAAQQGFRDPHPLADEINLLRDELELGNARDHAFRALAERTGVPELNVLVTAVRVGIRSGAPIQKTLEAQADRLRFRRHQDAVHRLGRSTAISVVPVFLCGVPLWLVLVIFPAAKELMDVFGK
ncbi:MAG: type II secretion system F family protein [Verrucomicrobiae bacterium]|nr:type II secretion system F family protein [Verrucomicrobiae bacterium]